MTAAGLGEMMPTPQHHLQSAQETLIATANFASAAAAITMPRWLPAASELAKEWTPLFGVALLILQIIWLLRKFWLSIFRGPVKDED